MTGLCFSHLAGSDLQFWAMLVARLYRDDDVGRPVQHFAPELNISGFGKMHLQQSQDVWVAHLKSCFWLCLAESTVYRHCFLFGKPTRTTQSNLVAPPPDGNKGTFAYVNTIAAVHDVFLSLHVSHHVCLSGLFFFYHLPLVARGDIFIEMDGSVCSGAGGTLCLVDLNGYSQPLLTYSWLPGN